MSRPVTSADEHPGDLLSAYLDDELTADEVRAVEAHLVHCGPCSSELDDLAAARRLLRTLPAVPAPPGFTRGLVERRRRASRRGATLALAAAAVAVLAGLALATPADDEPPAQSDTMSLQGDRSRLDATLGSGPTPASPSSDEPLMAQGGGTTTTVAPPASTAPTTTTTTTSTPPENDTGPEQGSDPDTVGDRIDELATNLLELIGG